MKKTDSEIRELCFTEEFDFNPNFPGEGTPQEKVRFVAEWRFKYAKYFYDLGAKDAGATGSDEVARLRAVLTVLGEHLDNAEALHARARGMQCTPDGHDRALSQLPPSTRKYLRSLVRRALAPEVSS